MKKAIITGITGQDGSYLAEFLLKKGYKVYGTYRRTSTDPFERIYHIKDRLTLICIDMMDIASLMDMLNDISPDEVYNLAAQSFVPVSWKQPILTTKVNAIGTMELLEAIKRQNDQIKFYQASSSEMFGKVREVPQREVTPFYPRSPYGISKVAAFWMAVNYRESYDMFASNGILFNHESPRRGKQFVTRKISHSVAKIKLGLQDKLCLGNLEAKRDWGFAGDYVEAMWLMMQQEKADDFVIATNETHSVRDFCKIAFDHVGLNYEEYVISDKRFFRPAEVDLLIGDYSKAKKKLGWKPRTSFAELVRMMVDHDIRSIKAESNRL